MSASRLLAVLLLGATLLVGVGSVIAQSTPSPQITERQESDRTIREYRLNGQLYAIEIRTADGNRYYLVDRVGDGNFSRMGGESIEIPDWVKSPR